MFRLDSLALVSMGSFALLWATLGIATASVVSVALLLATLRIAATVALRTESWAA